MIERELEALLFLAPDPVPGRGARRRAAGRARTRSSRGCARSAAGARRAAGSCCASSPAAGRSRRTPTRRRPRGGCSRGRARRASRPAQAETLSIVAYLQPVSRPEVARIRGVASESAAAALVERGLIEEAGRSQFGAVLYRTTPLFLKLFGLRSVDELPDPAQWDPSPEDRVRAARAAAARGRGAGRELTRAHPVAGLPERDGRPAVATFDDFGAHEAARGAVVGARAAGDGHADVVPRPRTRTGRRASIWLPSLNSYDAFGHQLGVGERLALAPRWP